jgi:hypothetical protein
VTTQLQNYTTEFSRKSVDHHPVQQTTWGEAALTMVWIHFGLVGVSNTGPSNGASDKSQNATISQFISNGDADDKFKQAIRYVHYKNDR